MGNRMRVSLAALRAYGTAADAISTRLAAAGAFDPAGNITALTPVFGLVGQDFLAAFAVAQANHAKAYEHVAATFGRRAQLAHGSAAAYENTDNRHAEAIRAIGREER